jgi:hypothetical protein
MYRRLLIALCSLALVLSVGTGCDPEDDENNDNNGVTDAGDIEQDIGEDVEEDVGDDTEMDVGDDTMDTQDDADADGATTFALSFTNTSDARGYPTPYSPPIWAISDGSVTWPELGTEASDGLEAVAEDGMAGMLETELGNVSGILEVGVASGPVPPGDTLDLTFTTDNPDARLHLATMFVQSNDVVLGTPPEGLALFDENGDPVTAEELADQMILVDAGTERNQAPYLGPNQAPRQADADTGPAEGVVAPFDDSTRAMPLPEAFVGVSVSEDAGTYTIEFENTSADNGVLVTPLGPVYWAVHNDQFSPWEADSSASAGLETLAEDGSPADLVSENSGATGLLDQGGNQVDGGSGPAMPGDTITVEVTPDASNPYLSFASMVVQSNDAFWAPNGPIMLLDENDDPRPAADVMADIMASLVVYDAGTEMNEVPGQGPNTAPNQAQAGDGMNEDGNVRRYDDTTNDLASFGDLVSVSVAEGANAGEFDVTVENNSTGTAFPLVITPVAYATHADSVQLFEAGMPAADAVAGLEVLAEDGSPADVASALSGLVGSGVGEAGVANMPVGGTGMGPLMPGDSYTFTVTPDANNPLLSFASMVVPSNDIFMATPAEGVALLDTNGDPRAVADINSDLSSGVAAWDAGTEANQAGAAGADMAVPPFLNKPYGQTSGNTGASEGDGTIRAASSGVWFYPSVSSIVSVSLDTQ